MKQNIYFDGNIDDIYCNYKHEDVITSNETGKAYKVYYGPEHDSYEELKKLKL